MGPLGGKDMSACHPPHTHTHIPLCIVSHSEFLASLTVEIVPLRNAMEKGMDAFVYCKLFLYLLQKKYSSGTAPLQDCFHNSNEAS